MKKNEEMAAWINKETTTYFVDGHKGSAQAFPLKCQKRKEGGI